MGEQGFQNQRPVEIVVFMWEEGSSFPKGLLGSLVLSGQLSAEEALAMRGGEGATLEAALRGASLRGDFEMNLEEVEYFVETHIEQGPVLDREGVSIGVVEGITGLAWIRALLEGEENHAGTTPMTGRKDPLVAAAEAVLFVQERAREMAGNEGSTVATVGRLNVFPGAPNVIPGRVEMGIDVRHVNESRLNDLVRAIRDRIHGLEARHGIRVTTALSAFSPPQPCSEPVRQIIERVSGSMGVSTRRMVSGAGHDAQNLAPRVKTGMIFVPSVNGVSHSPMEWTRWEDVERGIAVLTGVLKELSLTPGP
jgi:hydantoinase/carbamoylase family amidase